MAHCYPEPTEDIIIEPFAGSAAYSLHGNRWERQVILYDTNKYVYRVWKYLIEEATEEGIEELPDPSRGEDIRIHTQLSEEERWLIGYHMNPGAPEPRNICTERGIEKWIPCKDYIIRNLYKVKHWQIKNLSYDRAPDLRASWFIDPPYQNGGEYYKCRISYTKLSEWCLSRRGQVTVCESLGATWLPFRLLAVTHSHNERANVEVVWYGGIR